MQKTIRIGSQKQGVELTLSTMIQFIIAVIVFIVLLLFFTDQFFTNSTNINDAATTGIENAKNFEN